MKKKKTEENPIIERQSHYSVEDDEISVDSEAIPSTNRGVKDHRLGEEDLSHDRFRFKFSNIGIREDVAPISNKRSYLEEKRMKEESDENNFASLIQEPRLLPNANNIALPYRTIEIVFNNRNIYMNMQHFDPSRILYDLYDETLWKPFSPNHKDTFSAFYSPPIFHPPLALPLAKKLHISIIKEIELGISSLRSGKNLGTSWKNQKDPCVALMESHLLTLEKIARKDINESMAKIEKRNWTLKIRQFIPTYYRVTAVPAHFNYPEPDRIAQLFIEDSKDFCTMNHKNIKWAVAARIFPYISKVNSIRIIVAAFYPVPGISVS